eukprot:482825-Prorocentrum_minimum.AAC.1
MSPPPLKYPQYPPELHRSDPSCITTLVAAQAKNAFTIRSAFHHEHASSMANSSPPTCEGVRGGGGCYQVRVPPRACLLRRNSSSPTCKGGVA